MANLDRSEISRALAKAIAYKQCGKEVKANQWAARLVVLLESHNILTTAAYELAEREDETE